MSERKEPVAPAAASASQTSALGLLKARGGSMDDVWNVAVVNRTIATAWRPAETRTSEGLKSLVRQMQTAMEAFAPEDPVEAMIVAQAIGLHHGAMEAMRRAVLPDLLPENAIEAWQRAADLSRAMIEAVEALDRRRALAPAPAPAPQDPAPGPSWSAPPMHEFSTPKAPASDVSAEDVCSLIVQGPGYRGGPYREAD